MDQTSFLLGAESGEVVRIRLPVLFVILIGPLFMATSGGVERVPVCQYATMEERLQSSPRLRMLSSDGARGGRGAGGSRSA